ncbi:MULTISPECIES: hypothetical protein [unclassified Mesorhizobium]|uniref:hypothetical protein n=1 Tax=unclassified Mesorhizobium TaxID=325217 RepID=UPI00112A111A|nr:MULTISPECIES: hypothetical protein [unclassified Mesorhizobium]MBZ9699543.1 hypothetical protein [Mesorhizobium sp. CO1-1-3]MBZ9945796.1 hypothetical protein [Mesorhizobium sp. BR1-1-11]TPJ08226.1 hypothetical protein FJ428_07950 [Mesorhizobium sp. B2-8-1]
MRWLAPSRATTPKSGIYLFSEGSKHLYVGRSNRIAERYRLHCGPSAKENQASFAWKLTAEVMEHKATYRKGEGRKDKIVIPEFADAFRLAKERIRAMEYRFVEEADQTRQALLEAYLRRRPIPRKVPRIPSWQEGPPRLTEETVQPPWENVALRL